jgi:hypothetical protein
MSAQSTPRHEHGIKGPYSPLRTLSILAISALSMFATVSLSSCSSSKGSDTTVASIEPAATVAPSDSTVSVAPVSVEPDSVASDTTLLEPSIAIGEPNPASGTDGAIDPVPDSTLGTDVTPEGAAADGSGGPTDLTDEQLNSAFSAMGIPTTPEKLACVKEKAGKTDMSAPEPPPEFLRALMSCVPKSLVEANGQKLSDSAAKSGATLANAQCFQEKTFETMAATDIATFTKLLDANAPIDFPADIKATLKENTKDCALTEAQFLALLQG